MGKKHKKKSSQQHPEGERKFSQQQYDLLKSCSDKKDMTEWNQWRRKHPREKIRLQKAHLENTFLLKAHLENANLRAAHMENAFLGHAHLENAYLRAAHLENANLVSAHLEKANLWYAHLEHANLMGAHLENANLRKAHLEKVTFFDAHLENAYLRNAHLENAILVGAHLENATLFCTHLENAKLMEANLQGARFYDATLQGADFSIAIVDGKTSFSEDCKVGRKTRFDAVALGNLRIYPKTRQLLEYNIRRMNWEKWYRGKSENKWIIWMHQLLTLPVRLFWWVSNYGLSTWRIIFTFFSLAFIFAVAYWRWPTFVAFNGNPVMESFKSLWHAFYFSVVTMTTLGFGDIAANPDSWKGQGLLMLQVILGYVLLGAMVTRFAVLFTAGGPAGKFAPTKTKETAEVEKKKGE